MAVDAAVAALRRGGLVAFPTETVYGLGADAANPAALRHLYRVKGRPADHPVIVHVGATTGLDPFALDPPEAARRLARELWPGPLTIVVRRRPGAVAPEATGGRDTVGLRVPDHPLALTLLEAFGGGIAAPSANRFGRVSPTTAQHVRDDLGTDVDVVLDGGPCAVGVESTIVDCTDPREVAILRVGGVARAEIERVVGPVVLRTGGEVAAPGTLAAHYAPDARVEVVSVDELERRAAALLELDPEAGIGVIVMAPAAALPKQAALLARPSDVDEYARVLYAALRAADDRGLAVVLAVPPPAAGSGAAVADRLRRAAAGRDEPG